MALATRCPHCQTTFRVAHDQLKLRAGLVRCGACKQIFNGVENLLKAKDLPSPSVAVPNQPSMSLAKAAGSDNRADEASQQDHAAIQPSEQPPAVKAPLSSPEDITATAMQRAILAEAVPNASGKDLAAFLKADSQAASNDPLQRMTLMDLTGFEDEDQARANDAHTPDTDRLNTTFANNSLSAADTLSPDELDRTIEELQRKPWRNAKKRRRKSRDREIDRLDSAEPEFVKHARRQQRIGRSLRIAMGIGSAVLLIGVLVQSIYIFRDQIAARLPQTTPSLVRACAMLGCRIELPAQIDMVSIESSELQAAAPDQNIFSLVALLRNRAAIALAWPHIELTLNDANGKPIVRRVFVPRDYVPTVQDQAKGFAPNSEQPIKLFLTLSQFQASGYRIYLFYP